MTHKWDVGAATLPMYDFPEVRAATDAWYQGIREHAEAQGVAGLPPALTREPRRCVRAAASRTLFTQTCGMPLAMSYTAGNLGIVGIPVYSHEGCGGGREWSTYSSVVIVRAGSLFRGVADLNGRTVARNSWQSCSGSLLLDGALDAASCAAGATLVTGAHERSIRAVAEGRADAAAIDCITWALVSRHRPQWTRGTRVLARTSHQLTPPYVTADLDLVVPLRRALRRACEDETLKWARDTLGIVGCVSEGEQTHVEEYVSVFSTQGSARHLEPGLQPKIDDAAAIAAYLHLFSAIYEAIQEEATEFVAGEQVLLTHRRRRCSVRWLSENHRRRLLSCLIRGLPLRCVGAVGRHTAVGCLACVRGCLLDCNNASERALASLAAEQVLATAEFVADGCGHLGTLVVLPPGGEQDDALGRALQALQDDHPLFRRARPASDGPGDGLIVCAATHRMSITLSSGCISLSFAHGELGSDGARNCLACALAADVVLYPHPQNTALTASARSVLRKGPPFPLWLERDLADSTPLDEDPCAARLPAVGPEHQASMLEN